MNIESFCERFPRLFHMAHADAFDSILEYGLLSTSALLDLFEISGDERYSLESMHRPESVTITHPEYGSAVVRDQKPMSDEGVRRAVSDCSPREWYELLNQFAFFWLTQDRLERMLGARAYRGVDHVIITLDTESVLRANECSVYLSPINSGATKPFAHPRTRADTFTAFADYPFDYWMGRRSARDCVVEFAVRGGLRNVNEHIVDRRMARR